MEILQTADIAHAGAIEPRGIAPALDAGAAVAQGGVGGTRTGVTAASDAVVTAGPGPRRCRAEPVGFCWSTVSMHGQLRRSLPP